MKLSTTVLARTAMLGALVVIFDYTMKFSGLKIPFPWLPFLKFDFTGIPIVLSLLLIGFGPGAVTSAVAFLAILVRSGDMVGASMKALAEFSTILGMSLSIILLKKFPTFAKLVSFVSGCVFRVLVMTAANLVILPLYTNVSFDFVLKISPLVAAFNVFQGFLTMFGGYIVYEALLRRMPSLASKTGS